MTKRSTTRRAARRDKQSRRWPSGHEKARPAHHRQPGFESDTFDTDNATPATGGRRHARV